MPNLSQKVIALWLLLLIPAGGGVSAASRKDLAITPKEQKVEELTSSGLVLAFHLNIANSSASPYFLTSYSYRVLINL